MKRPLFTGAAVAALFVSASAVAAQSAPPGDRASDPTLLQDVVVTAGRSPQPADQVGWSTTVLTQSDIETAQAVVVSDLLERTPGVAVSRTGGVGQVTAVRIRGAEADHTLAVIDGVKLNDPSGPGGGYNFGNLLVGDVARIEVLRGPQSTLWGSQAIGGVVNIVTALPERPIQASLDAEAGSQGTTFLRGGIGGASDHLRWRVAGSHYRTEGVSSFARGTEADGYENFGFSGRADLALTEAASLDLRAVYSDGEVGIDGFPAPFFAFADTREISRTRELTAYAGLNFRLLDGRLSNRIAYATADTDRRNVNPAQALTTTTFDGRGENERFEYQGVLSIREGWTATFGAEHEDSAFRTASPSAFNPNPAPATAEAAIDGVFAQLQAEVVTGLTLTGGVRRDEHDTFGGKTLGQAAVAWSPNGGATVLRGGFGQGFKAPSLFQLYSDFGNVGLSPEEADGWDAGIEQRLFDGRVTVNATWFERNTANQIDFVSCPGAATPVSAPLCFRNGVRRFGYYGNIVRTEAQGLELAGAAELGALRLDANYTRTEAVNRSPGAAFGRDLVRRPRTAANLSATYVWASGPTITAAVRYAGERFDDASNTVRLDAYTLIDLRASYPINDALEVYGRVENVADEVYETTRDYGVVGRSAMLGVRARF